MSYALIAFDKQAAPKGRPAVEAWLSAQQLGATPARPYDPAVTAPALQKWFAELAGSFPPLNGPQAPATIDFATATSYTIGPAYIYASFPTEAGDTAHERAVRAARQHGVGLYSPGESKLIVS